MTISKAYNLLERDGVLERRPGKPLVVKELAADELESERLDQLRANLGDGVRAAKQLGITPDEAIQVFRDLLENDDKDD
jgi:DNA-binding transcriptional regulator YhcF (GntR family)